MAQRFSCRSILSAQDFDLGVYVNLIDQTFSPKPGGWLLAIQLSIFLRSSLDLWTVQLASAVRKCNIRTRGVSLDNETRKCFGSRVS